MPRRFCGLVLALATGALLAGDWPGWRGPNGDGVADDPGVPLRWSATERVAWKVPVPGVGHSSPIVAGERVFLTTFLEKEKSRELLCFDRAGGRLLWQREVVAGPAEPMHRGNTPASATPASDGRGVYTAFLDGGKIVVSRHDFSGERVWQKAFAGFDSKHGFCGSPALCGGLVLVNGDSDGDAFVAGLDARTGETRWRAARPNKVRSFSAPLLIDVAGRRQVVLAGSRSVAAFDPADGRQLWVVDSETEKFVATAAHADGVVFATGTSPSPTLVGIDPRGRGNVTKSRVLWSGTQGAAYVPSPLGVGKHFFVVSDAGAATLLEARTGERVWTRRLGRRHHASPLLVGGRLYCLDTDGQTFVLKAGAAFELLAKNSIEEECHATPAVSDGQLLIRGARHLWCIGERRANSR